MPVSSPLDTIILSWTCPSRPDSGLVLSRHRSSIRLAYHGQVLDLIPDEVVSQLREIGDEAPSVALDLSDCTMIASTPLGLAVELLRSARQRAIPAAIVRPHPAVYPVLELLGLTALFPIVDDDEALPGVVYAD